MSGNRYFLDTNAIIAGLNSNAKVEGLLQSATWIGTSVICVIEFLAYENLSDSDRDLFERLINRIEVIEVSKSMAELSSVADLKLATGLKLPDAIIAHGAIAYRCEVVSNDRHFSSVPNLSIITF